MVAHFLAVSPEKTFVEPQIFYGFVQSGVSERVKTLAHSRPEL